MADSPSRAERLLNLLARLLDTRIPVSQEDLVREIDGYPDSKSASRRAFERDKETLRAMGVPVRVERLMFGDGNDVGYRVEPDEYYLGDLDLSSDETVALNVAVNAISLGNAGRGRDALMKLGGLVGEAAAAPIASLPMAPALPAMFDATRRRAVVSFDYRGARRTVEAWALISRTGRWYLVGHDRDRDALRTFRVDRVEGDVDAVAVEDFVVPDEFDAREVLRDEPWSWGSGPPIEVEIVVDEGHSDALLAAVQDAVILRQSARGPVFGFSITDAGALRNLVLGFGDRAEILAPGAIRREIAAWLRAMA